MTPENDWDAIRKERTPIFSVAGMGILRIALLFGSAAVALALILAPAAENYARSQFAGRAGHDSHRIDRAGQRLYDPQERAAGLAGLRLHHREQRPSQRRLLTILLVDRHCCNRFKAR